MRGAAAIGCLRKKQQLIPIATVIPSVATLLGPWIIEKQLFFWAARWLRCAKHAVYGYSFMSRSVIPGSATPADALLYCLFLFGLGTGMHYAQSSQPSCPGFE
jgi:hypothetical protein